MMPGSADACTLDRVPIGLSSMTSFELSPIEDILAEARNARPFILVDSDCGESEGKIVLPAQFTTPDVINFMAKHARGLICLALTRQRCAALDLKLMSNDSRSLRTAAYTVSIEARHGVTTGISVHDRARTILVAADASTTANDIVTPGHVFPLVACDDGVLVRAGHTEAAIDIVRLAGLSSSAVVCEIMDADGATASLSDLAVLARAHDLKIGSIADLVAFRRRSEKLVEKVAEVPFGSHFGCEYLLRVYRTPVDGCEHIALTRQEISAEKVTLVRIRQVDMMADLLGWPDAHRDYADKALERFSRFEGPAAAVFVQDPMRTSIADRVTGDQVRRDLRDYAIEAQILKDLGIGRLVLLTASDTEFAALERFGFQIVNRESRTDPG